MYIPYNVNTTDYCSYTGQHVHEFIGSTALSGAGDFCHNHRFAAMTGNAIEAYGNHYHMTAFRTDTYGIHEHNFYGPSSLAIATGDGRHVHFVNGCTDSADGHVHEFRLVTQINNPADLSFF